MRERREGGRDAQTPQGRDAPWKMLPSTNLRKTEGFGPEPLRFPEIGALQRPPRLPYKEAAREGGSGGSRGAG